MKGPVWKEWDDIPPFHRFMLSAVVINLTTAREVDDVNRSGRFSLLHKLIVLAMWMWAMTVMVHELETMLMPGRG